MAKTPESRPNEQRPGVQKPKVVTEQTARKLGKSAIRGTK